MRRRLLGGRPDNTLLVLYVGRLSPALDGRPNMRVALRARTAQCTMRIAMHNAHHAVRARRLAGAHSAAPKIPDKHFNSGV